MKNKIRPIPALGRLVLQIRHRLCKIPDRFGTRDGEHATQSAIGGGTRHQSCLMRRELTQSPTVDLGSVPVLDTLHGPDCSTPDLKDGGRRDSDRSKVA